MGQVADGGEDVVPELRTDGVDRHVGDTVGERLVVWCAGHGEHDEGCGEDQRHRCGEPDGSREQAEQREGSEEREELD